MIRPARTTTGLAALRRSAGRLVRSSLLVRLVVGAVLFVASPTTQSIVEDAFEHAGFACCDDEGSGSLEDCCPDGSSHCAGCLHPPAIAPDAPLALEAPFAFEITYSIPIERAPTASFRAPPFRPPSA